MTTSGQRQEGLVATAFLPIHRVAFGVATSATAAIVTFLITAIYLVRNPQPGFLWGCSPSISQGTPSAGREPSSVPLGPGFPASFWVGSSHSAGICW